MLTIAIVSIVALGFFVLNNYFTLRIIRFLATALKELKYFSMGTTVEEETPEPEMPTTVPSPIDEDYGELEEAVREHEQAKEEIRDMED